MKTLCIILGSALLAACSAHAKPAQGVGGVISHEEALKRAVVAFQPDYPYDARRLKITGSGAVLVSVDAAGYVTSVTMRPSTGTGILDNAAISAFKRWRFVRGRAFSFAYPVAFKIKGVD